MSTRAACAIAIVLIAACGSSAPTPPRIAMLRLTPDTGVHPGEQLTVTIVVVDEDGDVAGGRAEIGLLREGNIEGDIFRVPLQATGTLTSATIALDIRLPAGAIPGHYDLSVVILDAATRRSNPLVAKFDVLN